MDKPTLLSNWCKASRRKIIFQRKVLRFIAWVMAVGLSMSVSLSAAELTSESFSFAKLQSFIESIDIRSVEELLPHLPADVRANWVLMTHTNSTHLASPKYPRILFFETHGKFAIAISTDPADSRRNTMEMIEFDQGSGEFLRRAIEFDPEKSKAPTFDPDGVSCLKCHHSYIWEPYRVWPGSLGGAKHTGYPGHPEVLRTGNFLPRDQSPEVEIWDALTARASEDPRLKHLIGLPGARQIDLDLILHQNNQRMSVAFEEVHAVWLATRISNHPQFLAHEAAILSALTELDDHYLKLMPGFSPDRMPHYNHIYRDTISSIVYYFDKALAEMRALSGRQNAEEKGENLNRYKKADVRAARLRIVLDEMGMSMDDFSFSFRRKTYAFGSPATHTMADLGAELVKRASVRHPEVASTIKYSYTKEFPALVKENYGGSTGNYRSALDAVRARNLAETAAEFIQSCILPFKKDE